MVGMKHGENVYFTPWSEGNAWMVVHTALASVSFSSELRADTCSEIVQKYSFGEIKIRFHIITYLAVL